MARSRLGEDQLRDEVVLTEAEHLVVDHSTCSGVPVTFLSLGDTPNIYDDGKYLVSTASGSVWQTGVQGDPGEGVPSGGTAGQILEKIDATDYNTQWSTPAVALPTGGTAGQLLEKQSGVDGDADWADPVTVTASGILSLLSTVDGTGSGLDADTLDGIEATGFLKVTDTKVSGQWHTGTSDPDGTTRLNYDGYLYATRVYNAWYNDLADFQSLHETESVFIPGRVYSQSGSGLTLCNENFDKAAVGIASDTFGMGLGKQEGHQVPIAVSGFVLAYVDRYPIGTPLVSNKQGGLTKAPWWVRLFFPERILATYYKDETYMFIGPNNISVDNRNWVKVK